MIDIISKQDSRHLTILETLTKQETSTIKELALLTHASRKTIQDDFVLINDYISPLAIITSNQGCELTGPHSISIDYIYSRILDHSLEFSLLELVFFETYERLEDYADALFISLSTLKRMIKRINTRTKKIGFKITTGPIELVGDEELICSVMTCFFMEKYITQEYPFRPVELNVLEELVNQLFKKLSNNLYSSDKEKIKITLLVTIIRIQHGHQIQITESVNTEKYNIEIFSNPIFKQSFKSIFKLKLDTTTLLRLLHPLANHNFMFNYRDLLKKTTESPEANVAFTNIQMLLVSLSKKFGIAITQQEQLLIKLFNVVMTSAREDYLIFNKNRLFLNNLLDDSPIASEIIYTSIKNSFQNKYLLKNYELEKFLYILITSWKELAKKIQTDVPVYDVGVFVPTNLQHGIFITGVLNAHFKGKFNFETILTTNLTQAEETFNDYQFILTTFSTLTHGDTEFIAIDSYPSSEDLRRINSLYRQLNKKIDLSFS